MHVYTCQSDSMQGHCYRYLPAATSSPGKRQYHKRYHENDTTGLLSVNYEMRKFNHCHAHWSSRV